ncbi:MAG: DHA2 family efflux MFS transporter permease subunit [Steroidobacteraceae bacterium]|jgi:MFS transporter, DHA2 family, multidrug resistance protein
MQRLLLTASTMLAVLLYAIDTTVANVALPVLQGSLSATREQASWVLTSYLIASALALPALAALEARLGLRRAFMLAIGGFGVASIGCGLAPNIEILVAARFLQGLCGAVLIPLGQTALQNAYPRELLARAFALLGVGVMVGPVAGPWVGGWLTENFGWRAVFFVNVPFLIVALGGMWATLRGEAAVAPRPFDRLGFVLLALCLVALQLAVDRGEQLDWFDSAEIVIEVFVACVAGYMFVAHAFTARNTLFSGQLIRNRNFMIGLLMAVCVGWPFMGALVLLPQFLQEVQGYNVMGAGLLMAPRGLGLMVAMAVLGRYAAMLDPRRVLSVGALLSATGLLSFSFAPADAPAAWLTLWLVVQGVGLGLIFVPINTVSFVTLAPELRTEGAALMTLARNIGGSLGVALIVRGISQDVTANAQRLASIAQVSELEPQSPGFAWLLGEIHREALVIAYSNQYVLLTLMPLLLLPLVWLTVMPRAASHRA